MICHSIDRLRFDLMLASLTGTKFSELVVKVSYGIFSDILE